jgi:hypothetical protein
VVVPVGTEPMNDPAEFPGLATTSLRRLFLNDLKLLVNTQWRSFADVVLVDLASGAVVPATPRLASPAGSAEGCGSWTCLDVCPGVRAGLGFSRVLDLALVSVGKIFGERQALVCLS